MRVFPISSLMMPVNLIQYRGTVDMFNNRRFQAAVKTIHISVRNNITIIHLYWLLG